MSSHDIRALAGRLAAESPARPAPQGFRPLTLGDPFEAYLGPFFVEMGFDPAAATRLRDLTWAFYVDERHLNANGIAHGGALATFADATLGAIAAYAAERAPTVTLSMQTSFLKPARAGDLIRCHAHLERRTPSILFVNGRFTVDGEVILTTSSLWKVIGRP